MIRLNVACKWDFITLGDVPCRVLQDSFLVFVESLQKNRKKCWRIVNNRLARKIDLDYLLKEGQFNGIHFDSQMKIRKARDK